MSQQRRTADVLNRSLNLESRTISMRIQHESKVMSDSIYDWKKGAIPPKWNGQAAERIVEHLK
jgi:hypothetical protein